MKYIIVPTLILIWWILVSLWVLIGKLLTISFDIFVNSICFFWRFKIWRISTRLKEPYTWYIDQPKHEAMEIVVTKHTYHEVYFFWKYGKW